MADKSLKATIQVDMDNRGVVRGVADTKNQLEKLNRSSAKTARAAGITAALGVAETGINLVRQAAQFIDRRVSQLTEITTKFSVAAQNAKIDADISREESMKAIAGALAPGAMEVLRAGTDVAGGEAARMQRNATQISGGMGATARFGENFMAVANILAEFGAQELLAVEQYLSGNLLEGYNTEARASTALFSELGNAQNFAYAPQGSARGMPYETPGLMERQTTALESIQKKIGGQ
jgi:hypothetical protein